MGSTQPRKIGDAFSKPAIGAKSLVPLPSLHAAKMLRQIHCQTAHVPTIGQSRSALLRKANDNLACIGGAAWSQQAPLHQAQTA